jgi:hypothetical protein
MQHGTRRPFASFSRLLPALALVASFGVACGDADTSASGSSLLDGEWVGDYIDFTVTDGNISDVSLHNIFCAKPHSEHAFLNACTSKPVEGSFSSGLAIHDSENLVTNDVEWRISGEVGPIQHVEGMFQPFGATPADFDIVQGTFFFEASDCECGGWTTFLAKRLEIEKPSDEGGGSEPEEGGGEIGEESGTDPTGGGTGGEIVGGASPELTTGGTHPPDATPDQVTALNRVNWYRERIGVPLIAEVAPLNAAASDHCACYAEHKAEYQSSSMSPHDEDSSWPPPCYGNLGARLAEKNYQASGYSEVMTFWGNPISAVDGWISTLYHRLPLTSPRTVDMGYGKASQCDTINTGSGAVMGVSGGIYVYPVDGQDGVDTFWNGYESPQPPAPPSGYPSGPIITAQFGSAVQVVITESHLLTAFGEETPHMLLTKSNDSWLQGDSTVALYAHDTLATAATYTVRLVGVQAESPWELQWSFTTAHQSQGQ